MFLRKLFLISNSTLSGIRGASRPHPPITLHDLDVYFSSLRNVDSNNSNGGKSTLRKNDSWVQHMLL